MPILLEIWVFMRWCEDLLWDHSEFARKNQLCSSLKVEFLQYPSHSPIGESEGTRCCYAGRTARTERRARRGLRPPEHPREARGGRMRTARPERVHP
jgi:hypothetical protein